VAFDVENIKPIHWPPPEADPMSTLILGDSDKDVIKALARKYTKHQGSWGADFIAGKGEGQIFLLHGDSTHIDHNQIFQLTSSLRTSWYREDIYRW